MGETQRTVYIAGPMTGLPGFNFDAFIAAEEHLRALGFNVCNPATMDGGDTSKSHEYYMRRDIKALCDCDCIAFLPGWRRSTGARYEFYVSQYLGIEVIDLLSGSQIDIELT